MTLDIRKKPNPIAVTEKNNTKLGKYLSLKNKADSISTLAENLYQHIENIKTNSLLSVKDPTDYEIMDKSETIDEMFFNPESFTTEGKAVSYTHLTLPTNREV